MSSLGACACLSLLWEGAGQCGQEKAGAQHHLHYARVASFPAEKLFFSFLIFKKNHSQNKTLTEKSKMAALTLFIKTRESLPLVGEPSPRGPLHFPGNLGPLASDGVLHGFELF